MKGSFSKLFQAAANLVRRSPSPSRKRRTAPLLESLETREVMTTGFGIAPDLMNYLLLQQTVARQQPSLLTPQVVAPQMQSTLNSLVAPMGFTPPNASLFGHPTIAVPGYNSGRPDQVIGQALRLTDVYGPQAGVNFLNYQMSPQGHANLVAWGGYGGINNLTGSANDAWRIINDPYIARMSGQLAFNGAVDYYTNNHTWNGYNGINGIGIMNSAGLNFGHVAQAQQVGALGGARAPGTGTGSPFLDMMGPPIGSQPQDRWTFGGGYATTVPAVASFGAPVGFQPAYGVFPGTTASGFWF